MPCALEHVLAKIDGYTKQVCIFTLFIRQLRLLFIHAEEDFLTDVLGLLAILQVEISLPENHGAILPNQTIDVNVAFLHLLTTLQTKLIGNKFQLFCNNLDKRTLLFLNNVSCSEFARRQRSEI